MMLRTESKFITETTSKDQRRRKLHLSKLELNQASNPCRTEILRKEPETRPIRQGLGKG